MLSTYSTVHTQVIDTPSLSVCLSVCLPLFRQFPPHHPRSDSFPDFIVPKVLYALASLGVGTCLAILRHPSIADLDRYPAWVDRLKVR